MPRTFVIGTRGSRLALRQTAIVADALRAAHPDVLIEVREVRTEGDRSAAPLSEIGGLGVFTKAIEDALLRRDVDLAVHSLKDLPPEIAEGLTIGAVPERGDPRDALVTRDGATLDGLPPGARIGTGSERRAVQLRALRRDCAPAEIRGNVDTRVRKVDDGEYDAAVLALAGLERLRLIHRAAQIFSVEEMLPAVGQAALGVEVRADDAEALALVAMIDHAETRAAVEAERAFLRRLGAGCRLPVGAYAEVAAGTLRLRPQLRLRAMIAAESGAITRREVSGAADEAAALGSGLAESMQAAAPGHS
ncbi:MAG: hydroxymethylbilane synthase [Dehalococcoidia bacterium]